MVLPQTYEFFIWEQDIGPTHAIPTTQRKPAPALLKASGKMWRQVSGHSTPQKQLMGGQ